MKGLALLALGVALLAASVAGKLDLFPGEDWTTGYLQASHPDKALFYYLFRCRNKTIANPPLLIWLEGGPGYTSAAGIYVHGGPYIVNNKTGEIIRNKFTWNNYADVLYIDQPAGTFFSYANDLKLMCTTIECVVDDLHASMQVFMQKYPEYRTRDMYISGISYGGHFVPAMAKRIMQDDALKSNLKGVIIFNGFYDSVSQSAGNLQFLYNLGYVEAWEYAVAMAAITACKFMHGYNLSYLYAVCGQFDMPFFYTLGLDKDPYYMEQISGADPYEVVMEPYLNRDDVQEALGVNMTFSMYNWTAFDYLIEDNMVHSHQKLAVLLNNGVKVYMVHGDMDYVCSHIGGLQVAHSIDWDGKSGFNALDYTNWTYKGTVLGQYIQYKNLKFVKVHHAGHSIFYQQREFGLEILKEAMGY